MGSGSSKAKTPAPIIQNVLPKQEADTPINRVQTDRAAANPDQSSLLSGTAPAAAVNDEETRRRASLLAGTA